MVSTFKYVDSSTAREMKIFLSEQIYHINEYFVLQRNKERQHLKCQVPTRQKCSSLKMFHISGLAEFVMMREGVTNFL